MNKPSNVVFLATRSTTPPPAKKRPVFGSVEHVAERVERYKTRRPDSKVLFQLARDMLEHLDAGRMSQAEYSDFVNVLEKSGHGHRFEYQVQNVRNPNRFEEYFVLTVPKFKQVYGCEE